MADAGGAAGREEGPRGRGGRIGVLGSAFNPPHLGHLVLAEEAIASIGLERVILVPTGQAPHKRIEQDPGAATRLRLARAAAAAGERLEVSSCEVDRPGPSYTCETLETIASENENAEVVFLMGADAARGLESWHRPERVVELASVAVARRQGVPMGEVEAVFERLGAAGRLSGLDMPEIGVSSSLIRKRAAAGRPLRYLIPEEVRQLIENEGLYAR